MIWSPGQGRGPHYRQAKFICNASKFCAQTQAQASDGSVNGTVLMADTPPAGDIPAELINFNIRFAAWQSLKFAGLL
jgi:hypothetical protein